MERRADLPGVLTRRENEGGMTKRLREALRLKMEEYRPHDPGYYAVSAGRRKGRA